MIFIKRIHYIYEKYLEVGSLSYDHQSQHLAIEDPYQNSVYVLTAMMLINHIIDFKNHF